MSSGPEINEFVFNQVGTDTNEFIEVEGAPNTDDSDLSLVVVDGDSGVRGKVDNIISVGSTDANGIWWTGFLPSNTLQNGTQTLLLVRNATVKVGQDLDVGDTGKLTVSPGAATLDSVAVTDGDAGDLTYSSVVLTPNFDGQNSTVGGASRIPDGTNTGSTADWERNDFNLAGLPGQATTPAAGDALNTPGAPNSTGTASVTPPTVLSIQAVNGDAYVSPYAGDKVTTTGVVTAIETSGSVGYWIQDPNANPNMLGSAGIFVYTGSSGIPSGLLVGDAVTVTGKVDEYRPGAQGLTDPELDSPTTTITGTGNAPPAATLLGVGGMTPPDTIYNGTTSDIIASNPVLQPTVNAIDFYRDLQGMVVTLNDARVVGATDQYGDTWVVPDGGAGSILTPEGGVLETASDMNLQRIQIVNTPGIAGTNAITADVGDTVGTVTGVLSYDFGQFELLPTAPILVTPGALAQGTTSFTPDADHLTVVDYNVENFSVATAGSRIDQLAGIIAHNLATPDILALQEIQDDDGATNDGVTTSDATLQALVAAVKADTGITYAYAYVAPANDTSGGQPGGNIRNAFLYNPARVTLVPNSLTSITDPNGAFTSSRNPLVGQFVFNGQTVTLIDVHNTSQSGSTESFGSVQPFTDYGVAQRAAQAQVITSYVRNLESANPAALVSVLGDFNDTDGSAAQSVYSAGADPALLDLDAKEAANARYDYVFEGNSEQLSHDIVSQPLYAITDYQSVHVNADFPADSQESDHDPAIASINLPQTVCFLAGTRIATPGGDRAIETLGAGDLVVTSDGVAQPIRWLGRQTIATRFADAFRVAPIRIRAGALDANIPVRDLLVSPDHALMVDGVFVQAGALVNNVSITREDAAMPDMFVYFHVELADHALILAEGVAAETFIDNIDRLAFDNWNEHQALVADTAPIAEMPHARAKSHRQVPAALRARLLARGRELTGDAVADVA